MINSRYTGTAEIIGAAACGRSIFLPTENTAVSDLAHRLTENRLEQFSTIRNRLMGANRFFGQARCAAHGDALLATAQNNPGQTVPYGRNLL